MLYAIALLLTCQLIGEALVKLLHIPIPGPVLGMLLLFSLLLWQRRSFQALESVTHTLLRYLALFFVPAGVGVIVYLGKLSDIWLALLITLLLSTIVTIVITGLLMQWLVRKQRETRVD